MMKKGRRSSTVSEEIWDTIFQTTPTPPWECHDRELTPTGSEQQFLDSLRKCQVGKKSVASSSGIPNGSSDAITSSRLRVRIGCNLDDSEEDR